MFCNDSIFAGKGYDGDKYNVHNEVDIDSPAEQWEHLSWLEQWQHVEAFMRQLGGEKGGE
jgi:hypothetical protein